MANEISEYISQIPIVTRILIFSTLLVQVLDKLMIVNPADLVVIYKPNLQLWRLITSFVVIPGTMYTRLTEIYFMYTYSNKLETEKFLRNTANYVYYLMIVGAAILSANLYMKGPWMSTPLLFALQYTCVQESPNSKASFMFGIEFPSKFLPLVSLGIKFLMQSSWSAAHAATGIFAAHLYLFFDSIYPSVSGANGGRSFIRTPKFLSNLIPAPANTYTSAFGKGQVRPYGIVIPAKTKTQSGESSTVSINSQNSVRRSAFSGKGYRLGE